MRKHGAGSWPVLAGSLASLKSLAKLQLSWSFPRLLKPAFPSGPVLLCLPALGSGPAGAVQQLSSAVLLSPSLLVPQLSSSGSAWARSANFHLFSSCFCTRYESGDHVAVYPANDSSLVNQIGEILGTDLDTIMSLNNLDGECGSPLSISSSPSATASCPCTRAEVRSPSGLRQTGTSRGHPECAAI